MAYTPTNWTNFPSTSTPVNASNLNKIESELVALDTGKVDVEEGKGLSTNDFDNTYKDKLDGISEQANKVEITPVVTEGTTLATISIDGVDTAIKGSDIDVDDELKPDSTNPVQNKIIYEALNDLLPEETAEGNPISISDASGLNAKECSVAFAPVQDLHGQSAPYPAGGGKNKLDFSRTDSESYGITYTVNSDGSVTANGTATGTSTFQKTVNLTFTEDSYLSGSPSLNGCQIDVNGGYYPDSGSGSTIPANTTITTVRIRVANGTVLNNVTFYPMIRLSGDATFAPYSNICPISGWTELNVARYGINLATTEIYKQGYVLGSDGSESVSSNYCITKKIFIEAGKKYILRFKENSGELSDNAIRIGFYKADGTFKSRSVLTNGRPAITIENDVAFLCFSYVNVSTSANYKWDLMFNEGETPLDYVPYQGTTHTATFPDTVYGGYYDFVSGEGTVAYGMLDISAQTWKYNNNNNAHLIYCKPSNTPKSFKNNELASIKCNMYKTVSRNEIGYVAPYTVSGIFVDTDGNIGITDQDNGWTSKEEALSFIANAQICYELATPTTISTSAEEIELLKGQNVLWTDGDNITLKYSADIKSYIAEQLSSLS